jgi:hypothetical protein
VTKTDHKTVASVRAKKERRGEIPHVEVRTDSQGRKQPAKRTPVVVPVSRDPEVAAEEERDTNVEEIRKEALPTRVMIDTGGGRMRPATPEEDEQIFAVARYADNSDEWVAEPETARENLMHLIGRIKANAEACRKIIKLSRFEDGARDEIRTAIERLIRKWKTVLSTLEGGHDDIAEPEPAAFRSRTPEKNAQYLAEYAIKHVVHYGRVWGLSREHALRALIEAAQRASAPAGDGLDIPDYLKRETAA